MLDFCCGCAILLVDEKLLPYAFATTKAYTTSARLREEAAIEPGLARGPCSNIICHISVAVTET